MKLAQSDPSRPYEELRLSRAAAAMREAPQCRLEERPADSVEDDLRSLTLSQTAGGLIGLCCAARIACVQH
jgi:hypothetical protein